MSILSEIRAHKERRLRPAAVWAAAAAVFGIGAYAVFVPEKPAEVAYGEYRVASGSVSETVSWDGKVTYGGRYELSFPVSGTLAEIYKREGESVKAGESIARLDDAYARIAAEKAAIALDAAKSDLAAKTASAPLNEDVRMAEAQLHTAEAAHSAAKRQAESDASEARKSVETALVSLRSAEKNFEAAETSSDLNVGYAERSFSLVSKELEAAESQLARTVADGSWSLEDLRERAWLAMDSAMDPIMKNLGDVDVIVGITEKNRSRNDAYETYLSAKDSSLLSRAETAFREASGEFAALSSDWEKIRGFDDVSQTDAFAGRLRSVSGRTSDAVEATIDALRSSVASPQFPQESIDARVASLEASLANSKARTDAAVAARQSVDRETAALATAVASQRDSVAVFRLKTELSANALEKAKADADASVRAAKTARDLAAKRYESAQSQYSSVRKRGEDSVSVAAAQSSVSVAALDLKRRQFSERELAPFETAVRSAEKNLEEWESRLRDTVLKSPADGTVASLASLVGEEIPATAVFATVIDAGRPHVESDMEEIDVVNVRLGQTVLVSFDAVEDVVLTGSVTFVSPTSKTDANGIVTYRVDVAFDAGKSDVREGMSASLEYVVREAGNVLVVPASAIVKNLGTPSVFSLDRDAYVPVSVGISDGKTTQVSQGVALGERIRKP